MSSNAGANFGGNFSGIPVVNPAAPSGVHTIGTDLPHVDPNNYSGNIHFGPATTVSEPYPPGMQSSPEAQFQPGMQLPNATFHPGT